MVTLRSQKEKAQGQGELGSAAPAIVTQGNEAAAVAAQQQQPEPCETISCPC